MSIEIHRPNIHSPRTKITPEMQQIALNLIDESDINDIIQKLKANKHLKEDQRLWVMFKVSQIMAGRNIIAIASDGLRIIGVQR